MEIKKELRSYIPLAQMLVQTLGPDCEVVLHDLDNPAHSVVYVENPSVTGRKVGESFDQLVKQVILSDELTDGSEIEKLDLTMVSDIKRPKGGGLEVKFFDRLKALDRLCELSNAASAGENSDFLCALDRSARALRGDDAGE